MMKDTDKDRALEFLPYLPLIFMPIMLGILMVALVLTFTLSFVPFIVGLPFFILAIPFLPLLPLLALSSSVKNPLLASSFIAPELTKLSLATQSLMMNAGILILAFIVLSVALPIFAKYAKQQRSEITKADTAVATENVPSEKNVPSKVISPGFENHKRTSKNDDSKMNLQDDFGQNFSHQKPRKR